jgi:hypothetical protein
MFHFMLWQHFSLFSHGYHEEMFISGASRAWAEGMRAEALSYTSIHELKAIHMLFANGISQVAI